MIERTYRCNLCREQHELKDMIGLYWKAWPKGWEERSPRETENHLCMKCLSSLQSLPPRCGGGFECTGGPDCGSDHK